MFRGPLTVLLLRLGGVGAGVFAAAALFWLFNREQFPARPLRPSLGGMRFDASAIAWLNLPWVLLVLGHPTPGQRFARIQFGSSSWLNAIGLFFNCVDIAYYDFTLKRSTADFFRHHDRRWRHGEPGTRLRARLLVHRAGLPGPAWLVAVVLVLATGPYAGNADH